MENHGVRNGVICGLASVIITLLLYFISPPVMFKWGSWIGIAVAIYFMSRASLDTRADMDGFISWKEAVSPAFLTGVISTLIGMLFTYVLFNFIDSSLMELQNQVTIDTTVSMMESFGAAESDIDAALEGIEASMKDHLALKDMILPIFVSFIFTFIIAAIIAAVVKKTRPEMA